MSDSERGVPPSPMTVIFVGNGAGQSASFDAVLFVLGQVICFSFLIRFDRMPPLLDTYVL